MSKRKLWAAQLEHYPDSVQLKPYEVFNWCDEARDMESRLYRWAQVALAIQYPQVVWYRIEGTTYRGFRFGVQGHKYASLYSGEVK